MTDKLSIKCEFEQDCPTLKSLAELARRFKKESILPLYNCLGKSYDILKNNFCSFGQFEECPTYQRLLKEETDGTETTELETEPVLSKWPRAETE